MKLKNKKILLIKLGGSVITDKSTPYTARIDVIRRLARELKNIKNTSLVLSHGSGSFGHISAQKYGGKKGYKSAWGVAKVARDAMEINRIVMDILIEEGLSAVSLRPMSMMVASAGKLQKDLFEIVELTINQGLIPVVYGDVIWDKEWKSTIYSGETTLNKIGIFLSKKGYNVSEIIQVGQTDGVYDLDRKTVPLINKNNWDKIKGCLFESKRADVTGGMEHKVESALKIAKSGINTFLINGERANDLSKAISGKQVQGTLIKNN